MSRLVTVVVLLVQLAGLFGIVVGAMMFSIPAGIILAGVFLLAFGVILERHFASTNLQ